MVMTDPIADMLTRIRNAQQMKKETVNIPHSKIKLEIAKVMEAKGFITNVTQTGEGVNKEIVVTLKYNNKQPVIHGIKRISKPGLRVYAKAADMPKVLNGLGVAIVSTSKGITTDQEARKNGVGGEVIAYIW